MPAIKTKPRPLHMRLPPLTPAQCASGSVLPGQGDASSILVNGHPKKIRGKLQLEALQRNVGKYQQVLTKVGVFVP
ncbi:hypothetical protein [Aestuariirhabdus sp. LZHN29]|uniref:hypothetical protein n=1 Tax=Aestuariirhabdus sp. LZHN29 TaxID=3417462 RepID=UPI003CF0A309